MYEQRLKTEFELLQRLQKSEVKNIVSIYYTDRIGNGVNNWKSIMEAPSSSLHPNHFKVTYTFPKMYVGPDKIVKKWQGSIIFSTPENKLMNIGASMGVDIEGGSFRDDMIPYNTHINKTFICTGDAWQVSQQGMGIWYFVILVGCLFNLDKCIVDNDHSHFYNNGAWEYWKHTRKMQSTNDIKWPFNLDKREDTSKPPLSLRIGQRQLGSTPTFKIGNRTAHR